MLPKWGNRIGGAEQFMSTHCFSMAEAERVEPTGTGLNSKIVLLSTNKTKRLLTFLLLITY